MRLSALYATALCEDDRGAPTEARRRHFRSAVHRRLSGAVSVQPHRAQPPAARHVPAIVRGRDGDRSRRQRFLRPYRLLRRQCARLRLLQGGHRARPRARARAWPGARRLSSGGRRERAAAEGDFRPRRSVVPHVGHRSGHAGGAARPLSHPPHRTWCASAAPITAGGATCSRASAIRCRRTRPIRCKDMSEDSLRVLRTRRDIACVLVNPLQALHPNAAAPAIRSLVDSGRSRAFRQGGLCRLAASSCARSAPSATSS